MEETYFVGPPFEKIPVAPLHETVWFKSVLPNFSVSSKETTVVSHSRENYCTVQRYSNDLGDESTDKCQSLKWIRRENAFIL